MYKVVVFKSYGPFSFEFESYDEAMRFLKDKWFSSGVWDVKLFEGGKELEISDTVRSWGQRPIYC